MVSIEGSNRLVLERKNKIRKTKTHSREVDGMIIHSTETKEVSRTRRGIDVRVTHTQQKISPDGSIMEQSSIEKRELIEPDLKSLAKNTKCNKGGSH